MNTRSITQPGGENWLCSNRSFSSVADFGMDHAADLVKRTHFPWLMSNVYDSVTENTLADGCVTHMISRNGRKVGSYWSRKVMEFYNLYSRPGKSWNFCPGHGKSWNLMLTNMYSRPAYYPGLLSEMYVGKHIQLLYIKARYKSIMTFQKVSALPGNDILTTNLAACVCLCVCAQNFTNFCPTLLFRLQTYRKFCSHSKIPIRCLWTAFCVPLFFIFYEKQ